MESSSRCSGRAAAGRRPSSKRSPGTSTRRPVKYHSAGPMSPVSPAEDRNVGIVFQRSTLYPHMTVGENVAYGLQSGDLTADRESQRVDRYLELVELADRRDASPESLSGGARPPRRTRPRPRSRTGRPPARRAVVGARQGAQSATPRGDRPHPAADRRDDAVRHPRSGGRDVGRGPARRPPRWGDRRGWSTSATLRIAAGPLRRVVSRALERARRLSTATGRRR